MELFNFLPQSFRQEVLKESEGQVAIKFPSAYFKKAQGSMSPVWVNVTSIDSEGMIIKTAPVKLIDSFVLFLQRCGIDYEIIQL